MESNREALVRTKEQMVVAQAESEKPFPREQELREKSQRLAELTKLLKLDEKDRELLDSVPDEGEKPPPGKWWEGSGKRRNCHLLHKRIHRTSPQG